MSNNKNLQVAKVNAYDEFYTRYEDIAKKMANFDFKGKVVYCNCDDWRVSNFFKYFYNEFSNLVLKKLLCTGYNASGYGYYASFDGSFLSTDELFGNGDFRSNECWLCLQACDIVVSNPPFSLFREYMDMLFENKKDFIIIGHESGITYKNVFPYVMNNNVWIGSELVKEFISPDGSIKKFGNICWYTNVESKEVRKRLPSEYKLYSFEYKKYDNYNAINVDKIKDIPINYYGVIGVPVSYMKYHNPMLYDIVGLSSSSKDNAGKYFLGGTTRPSINGKKKFTRLFIKRKNNVKKVS